MKGFFWCIFFSLILSANAQIGIEKDSINEVYFEDQFYLAVTYNLLRNIPDGLSQTNLSYGLDGGFIKDIPISASGRHALGIGLGLALNNYYSNLVVTKDGSGFNYSLDEGSATFKRSKLETYLLELPIEFRWRNSTLKEYKFWRIYGGLKMAYAMGARSKLVTNTYKDIFFNTDVAKFQYGLMLNVGYNTFNVHVYYALSSFFDDNVLLNDAPLAFKPLRLGLIFYIL